MLSSFAIKILINKKNIETDFNIDISWKLVGKFLISFLYYIKLNTILNFILYYIKLY